MTLTDEQRAGVAALLGSNFGWQRSLGEWQLVDFRQERLRPLSDADLMLALLNRATEIGYEPESDYDSHQRQWFERIRMWMQDHPMLFGEGKSADKAEAVILAVLQLPEAQQPKVHP